MSLDGVTIYRLGTPSLARGASLRLVHVNWDEVTGAEIQTTSKGRVVVRLRAAGAPSPDGHHRDDPYAVKVARDQSESSLQLVKQINDEVATRTRWRQHTEIPSEAP